MKKRNNKVDHKVNFEKEIIYEELYNSDEVSSFLGNIWGSDSPLKHVGRILRRCEISEGSSLYFGARYKNEIIALLGIKFIENKTVELGSIAVHPDFRGLGLTKRLFLWRTKILTKLIKNGYQLITFATVGSNILNFIGKRIGELPVLKLLPMNIGVGVVPINKEKFKEVLINSDMIHKLENKFYTSTLTILASNRPIYFEDIESIKKINLIKLFPCSRKRHSVVKGKNISFKLDPIRLSVEIIRDNDCIIKVNKEYFNQIQIPVLSEFEKMHNACQKNLLITGFTIHENVLHIVYSNVTRSVLVKLLNYLSKINDSEIYKEWVYFLKMINKLD